MRSKVRGRALPKKSELNDLYISQAIKSVAFSFTTVFIPIFLLNLGYSFQLVLLFFVAESLLRIGMSPISARLVARFGAKPNLAISYFLGFAFSCLLAILPSHKLPVLLLAAVSAVFQNLHWISFHVIFSRASSGQATSKQAGVMDVIFSVASAIGPLLGGVIASQIGINSLFWISPIILLFGIHPLLRTKEIRGQHKVNYRGMPKKIRRDMVSMLGFGTELGATMLWPLYIYIVLETYQSVGFITAISVAVGIVTALTIGKLADKHGPSYAIKAGVTGSIITHMFRGAAAGFGGITLIGLCGSVSRTILAVPYNGQYYRHANRGHRIEYISLMEMSADASRLVYYAILLAATFYLPMKSVIVLGFFVAAVAVPLTMFMKPGRQHASQDRRAVLLEASEKSTPAI